ncbi:MAG: NADP-dependent oxidoreductase [Gordonia sp. (in: high G+C Gram-positive bacteria)]
MTSTTQQARQAIASAYGDPAEVIDLVDVALPEPGAGQAVIAVQAIGVNPIDAKIVAGLMGADESRLPRRPGHELAGRIEALGPEVSGFAIGDAVIAYPVPGAFADRVIVEVDALRHRPDTLDAPQAAGLLLVGTTAADAVATARVTPDDTVVVHGGAGAVGVIAIQLARGIGATVIATASPANHDFLRSLGAVPVAYGDGVDGRIRAAAEAAVTAAIDTVGTDEAIDASLALGVETSRIVSIAAWGRGGDGIVLIDGSSAESQRTRAAAVDTLIADAAAGTLVTEVAATYPLEQAGAALTDQLAAHPRGKLIITPTPAP